MDYQASNLRIFYWWDDKIDMMLEERHMGKNSHSEEKINEEDKEHTIHSSESLGTKDFIAGGYSSQNGEVEQGIDTHNIEQVESSLREGGCLNNEEARVLLGRLEYQRGNIDVALHVFYGINIHAIAPKVNISILIKAKGHKLHSHWDTPPMSIHAISLLFEAIFLKACALHGCRRFKEAAQSLSAILDTLESTLPEGLLDNFGSNSKLQEMVCRSVELLSLLLWTKQEIGDNVAYYESKLKWKNTIETYTDLIAIIQLKSKSSNVGIKSSKEMEQGIFELVLHGLKPNCAYSSI